MSTQFMMHLKGPSPTMGTQTLTLGGDDDMPGVPQRPSGACDAAPGPAHTACRGKRQGHFAKKRRVARAHKQQGGGRAISKLVQGKRVTQAKVNCIVLPSDMALSSNVTHPGWIGRLPRDLPTVGGFSPERSDTVFGDYDYGAEGLRDDGKYCLLAQTCVMDFLSHPLAISFLGNHHRVTCACL